MLEKVLLGNSRYLGAPVDKLPSPVEGSLDTLVNLEGGEARPVIEL